MRSDGEDVDGREAHHESESGRTGCRGRRRPLRDLAASLTPSVTFFAPPVT